MRSAIDTNILAALWSREPSASLARQLLQGAAAEGGLVICGAVYAEAMACPGVTVEFLARFLTQTGIKVEYDLNANAWRQAGQAFADYAQRRRTSGGGEPKRLLVDFLIGAHAQTSADRLLSFDRNRYAAAFPKLMLLPLA